MSLIQLGLLNLGSHKRPIFSPSTSAITAASYSSEHAHLVLPTTSRMLAEMKTAGEIVEVQGGHIVRPNGRKDRHHKVCTAKGARDCRVRLSAYTAIQFYDVQDRLGYDRPSKAVDWLMKKAKAAIDDLVPASIKTPISAAEASGSGSFIPRDLLLSVQDMQDGIFFHNSDSAGLSEQNQILTQREPLQSSNLHLFRPWMETMDQEMLNTSSSSIGFSGFRIPARIQGDDEHDSISHKLSSRSSGSYH